MAARITLKPLYSLLRVYGQMQTADREVPVKEEMKEFANNRWCNPGHVAEKEHLCSPDVELLAEYLSMLLLTEFICFTC